MKLYRVENGFTGNGSVFCLVIAPNEVGALALGTAKYKADADAGKANYVGSEKRPTAWWDHCEVTLLCTDTTKSWVSEVED